jgi:Putative prokaryotic signal transducing protein
MTSPDDPVALEWAPNPLIAELWISMLDDAGIPAYVEGTNLVDEYAFAQKLVGAFGQTVFVRQRDRAEALAILAKARDDAARNPDTDTETETETETAN